MDAPQTPSPIKLPIGRLVGIRYGFANQILFAVTVWYLFWFMRDGSLNPATGFPAAAFG